MNCEVCGETADFEVFAAYDKADSHEVHPTVNRYPHPMIIACSQHLAVQIERDSLLPGSTLEWVMKKVQN